MSEMVERVARAYYGDIPELDAWEDISERSRNAYRSGARAAIEAMRVPTQKMDLAGLNHVIAKGDTKMIDPRIIWYDMIDEALK